MFQSPTPTPHCPVACSVSNRINTLSKLLLGKRGIKMFSHGFGTDWSPVCNVYTSNPISEFPFFSPLDCGLQNSPRQRRGVRIRPLPKLMVRCIEYEVLDFGLGSCNVQRFIRSFSTSTPAVQPFCGSFEVEVEKHCNACCHLHAPLGEYTGCFPLSLLPFCIPQPPDFGIDLS